MRRIGSDFNRELKEIEKEREKKKKLKMSRGKITNQLVKHNSWGLVKEDLINFNKKGLSTVNILLFLFFAFLIVIFLGLYVFVFNTITTNLEIDQVFGQVNLKNVTELTLGQLNDGLLGSADLLGYTIIFGMILLMLVNAYFTRGKYNILFIIIDMVILVFAYILSVYLTDTYSTYINSTTLLNVYANYMPLSSKFILNLPHIVGIIGALIMILSYSNIPKKEGEPVFNAT